MTCNLSMLTCEIQMLICKLFMLTCEIKNVDMQDSCVNMQHIKKPTFFIKEKITQCFIYQITHLR